MLQSLLKKLIQTGTGKLQRLIGLIGLGIAVLLLLIAIQLQSNYKDLLWHPKNKDSIANFLVISKQMNKSNVNNSQLSSTEINQLKQQPFVEKLGWLTASKFKVSAQSISERIPFYTDLFFESVPDEFLDVRDKEWKWDSSVRFIPLIVPNMFIDMYNFGFATSQNLPQLSKEAIKILPIQINIYQHGVPVTFIGRVVGFSDRISSVLVPQTFMDWANLHFGSNQINQPSRVIIQTKDPGNPALIKYLKDNQLTTDADKTRFSKYRQIVDAVVRISGITGLLMLAFALLILSLFIKLSIASSKSEIELLMQIGMSPKQLRTFMFRHFFPPNVYIIAGIVLLLAAVQYWIASLLSAQQIFLSYWLSLATLLGAIALIVIFWLTQHFTIKQYTSS